MKKFRKQFSLHLIHESNLSEINYQVSIQQQCLAIRQMTGRFNSNKVCFECFNILCYGSGEFLLPHKKLIPQKKWK